jgi:mRNA interferase RelE/StbE
VSYRIRFRTEAVSDLEDLDRREARRIHSKLTWFAENFENLQRESLSGELSSFCKFRIGPYRVLYAVDDRERMLTVHAVGHRRDIYR